MQMRTLFIFTVLGLLFSSNSAFAIMVPENSCARPVRVLRLGDDTADVRILQQLLNQNIETRVSESGPGALGLETTFFGTRTLRAVIKFQEHYAAEVLTPAGLTRGTGYVGTFTLSKIHALCQERAIRDRIGGAPSAQLTVPASGATTTVATTTTPPAPSNTTSAALSALFPADDTFFHVKYPSKYVVHPGDKVTIYGGGFTATNNTVFIGTLKISGVVPTAQGVLDITIPADAAKGKFDVWVENTRGISDKTFIIITAPDAVAPVVGTFSPMSPKIGNTITVMGSGFTPTNNQIRMSVGTLEGIPSTDGKSLSFLFTVDIPGVTPELIPAGEVRNIAVPVSFYVVNANGISNRSTFTVTY